MMSDRKTAVIAGMFFILAAVMGVTIAVILAPLLGAEAPHQAVLANAGLVRLSLWGLVGGGLILALDAMKVLGLPYAAVETGFTAPIALNEMVLAVWLIVKGFSKGERA